MDNIKVSIIMPSLNVAKYIRESLESAVNQTLEETEIICVDAGSTDGTLEIIKEFVEKDTRVKLLNSPVKSYGYQMNLGISEARGEYIGIIETDDIVKPEMYEELYKVAEKRRVDFVKTDFCTFVTEDGVVKLRYVKLRYVKLGDSSFYGYVINPRDEQKVLLTGVNTWNGIYKRSFLEANNIKHNESAGAAYQDNGFFFQTFSCAERIYFFNRAYYLKRGDNPDSSVYNSNWFPRMLAEYQFIYSWLRKKNLLEAFKGAFARKKYSNLLAGVDKAPSEKREEYCDIFSREMALHIKNGEYDKDYFTYYQWKWIERLINDPAEYCIKRTQLKQRKYRDLGSLKNSVSIRVVKVITWLPRKIRVNRYRLKEHGLLLTLKGILMNDWR